MRIFLASASDLPTTDGTGIFSPKTSFWSGAAKSGLAAPSSASTMNRFQVGPAIVAP